MVIFARIKTALETAAAVAVAPFICLLIMFLPASGKNPLPWRGGWLDHLTAETQQRPCVQFVAPDAWQTRMIEAEGYRLDHRDGDNYYFRRGRPASDKAELARQYQACLSIGRNARTRLP
jgi:hypothetical protein